MEKSYRDQLVTARGYLYEKILAALSVRLKQSNRVMFVANKKGVDFGAADVIDVEFMMQVPTAGDAGR